MSAAERMAMERRWALGDMWGLTRLGDALGERYGFSNIEVCVESRRTWRGIWDQEALVRDLGWCSGLWIRPWARLEIDVLPEDLFRAFGRRKS